MFVALACSFGVFLQNLHFSHPSAASSSLRLRPWQDLARFKQVVKSAANEYLQSNDFEELKRIILDLDQQLFHQDLPYVRWLAVGMAGRGGLISPHIIAAGHVARFHFSFHNVDHAHAQVHFD